MKRRFLYIVFIACACAYMWSCGERDEGLVVSPSQLWGEWVQVSDTNYHWTYNTDGTGTLIHTGSFDPGDEHNGYFNWKINGGDELEVEFTGSGELGGIAIIKLYTIKSISSTAMEWVDSYGRRTKYRKL